MRVWSGFNENIKAGTWYSWCIDSYTHSPKCHRPESDWIKAVMSSYHRIEGINIFVFACVINSTQEATKHRRVEGQTHLWTINRRRWKNHTHQVERERKWERKIQMLILQEQDGYGKEGWQSSIFWYDVINKLGWIRLKQRRTDKKKNYKLCYSYELWIITQSNP